MIAAETAKAVSNPFVATAPPNPGPSAIPRYRAEVYHPYARPRKFGGLESPTYDIIAGEKQASPTPEKR